ncbi:MAG: hypothetical protein JSV91_08765 [Phycisphaerales bacterium]|nr:MAG: hypothetical protein JSV91_08765 [Phycisphaerales bacterium]
MPVAPEHAVRCLKEAGARSVWLIRRPGEGLRTLKMWPLTPAIVFKLILGLAQPQRQVRGARRLTALGLNTPSPVGRWRLTRLPGRLRLTLEMEFIPGPLALEVLADAGKHLTAGLGIAARIGRMTRTMADGGLLHRDLKLSNIVIAEEGDQPTVWLIDPVGVRPMSDRLEALVRMFDRLMVEPLETGIPIPRRAWWEVLRAAVRGLPKADRREVIRRLRSRPRS